MHTSENYTTKKLSKSSQVADVMVSDLFPYITKQLQVNQIDG